MIIPKNSVWLFEVGGRNFYLHYTSFRKSQGSTHRGVTVFAAAYITPSGVRYERHLPEGLRKRYR
jgi:hypothetical protein